MQEGYFLLLILRELSCQHSEVLEGGKLLCGG